VSKKTILSVMAVVSLGAAAFASPALGGPGTTYTGTVSCENVEGSTTTFFLSGQTRAQVRQFKKDHLGDGLDQCDGMGSYDTSGLLPD
jgi:hypothetical protein